MKIEFPFGVTVSNGIVIMLCSIEISHTEFGIIEAIEAAVLN